MGNAKPKRADRLMIVLARAEKTRLEPTGRYVMHDRNYFPEFEAQWEGKAVVWLRSGAPEDVRKAEEHAAREGYKVFTFPASEPEPLERAKELALAGVR